MEWKEFKVTVPGKWVLAGEHSVLRGGQAIALPHPSFSLTLHYVPASETLKVLPEAGAVVLHDLMRLASEWLERHDVRLDWPKGILHLESTIPLGAGLGSSAALSVAVARWLLSATLPVSTRSELIEFARFLENRFHGKSSGMDVTTVVLEEPILFSMEKGPEPLRLKRLPEFHFHDSGLRASTLECVKAVKGVAEKNPELGRRLDREMQRATELALRALRDFSENERLALELLQESMASSTEVFRSWGLIPPEVEKRLNAVKSDGARAVRITGAGMGGFVVSV